MKGLTTAHLIALGLTVLFAAGRLFYPSRGLETFSVAGAYEALAHMVVGGLLAAWLLTGERVYKWSFLGLTAVEVVMFLPTLFR